MKIGIPKDGRFGEFGGKYIPETLAPAIDELEKNYSGYKNVKFINKAIDVVTGKKNIFSGFIMYGRDQFVHHIHPHF